MKIILAALNSKFSHSSLALLYLEKFCKPLAVEIAEFSINDAISSIFGALWEKGAQIYCFSCYIWNMEMTVKVASLLKLANPHAVIIFGGPEVTYCAQKVLADNPFVDYLILGEGEEPLRELLLALEAGIDAEEILGTANRKRVNPFRQHLDLSKMPLPYTAQDIHRLKHKILYFETSRGCPYSCSYCLSSADCGVRSFSMEYIKAGFLLFFQENVPLVKLIDRTFNYKEDRAIEIIRFIIEHSKNTRVHLEIAPNLLTDKLVQAFNDAPAELFQLEMGIQTINPDTLRAIGRKNDLEVIRHGVSGIRHTHIHMDLIAGLPYEDLESFERSFEYVYSLRPDMLQLGFLKVLHGTRIKENHQIVHATFPPYEVISTEWLNVEEILLLKRISDAVEAVYNSGAFPRTVEKLTTEQPPMKVFERIGVRIGEERLKRVQYYTLLYGLFGDAIREELLLDFMEWNQSQPLPAFFRRWHPADFKKNCFSYVKEHQGCVSQDFKDLRFEAVEEKVIFVDYKNHILSDVTEVF